jgi:hypothetical protein
MHFLLEIFRAKYKLYNLLFDLQIHRFYLVKNKSYTEINRIKKSLLTVK